VDQGALPRTEGIVLQSREHDQIIFGVLHFIGLIGQIGPIISSFFLLQTGHDRVFR